MADFSLGPSQADADAFMREAQQKPQANDDDETVAPDGAAGITFSFPGRRGRR